MSSIWNLLAGIRTIRSYYQNWIPDIRYDVWRCSSLRSSRDDLVERSSLHFHRWDLLYMAWVANILISHRDTFIVQGFYAHKISILAESKKVAAAIMVVSRKKFYCIQDLNTVKNTSPYTAFLHSTWRRDSGWRLRRAEEILLFGRHHS